METESRPEALLQSQKWQLIGMSWWYRSALCTHPVSASANNWTCGLQQADIPSPQSATLGLHPVARKILLISHPTEGRRLSWPELVYTVCAVQVNCTELHWHIAIQSVHFVQSMQCSWTGIPVHFSISVTLPTFSAQYMSRVCFRTMSSWADDAQPNDDLDLPNLDVDFT